MSDLGTLLGGTLRQDTAQSRTSPLLQALIMQQVKDGGSVPGVERVLEEQNQELARLEARETQSRLMKAMLEAEQVRARGALDKTFVEQLKDTAPIHGGLASLDVMRRLYPGYGVNPATSGTTSALDANRILQGRAKALEDAGQGAASAAKGGIAIDPAVAQSIFGQNARMSTAAPTVEHQDQLRGKQVDAAASNQRGQDNITIAEIQAGGRVDAAALMAEGRKAVQSGRAQKMGTEQRQFTRNGELVTETVNKYYDPSSRRVYFMDSAGQIVDQEQSAALPDGTSFSRGGASLAEPRMGVPTLPGASRKNAENIAPQGAGPNESVSAPQGVKAAETKAVKTEPRRGGLADVTNDPAMATALSEVARKYKESGSKYGELTEYEVDEKGTIWGIIKHPVTGMVVRHAFTGPRRQEVIEQGRTEPSSIPKAGRRF